MENYMITNLKINKQNLIKILIIFLLFFLSANVFARGKRGVDYFLKPQLGLWFGPITPIYSSYYDVDINLGGGAYFRYNTIINTLKIGVESTYQNFESEGVNTLTLCPVYANLIYRIPINAPLKFQFKAGAGTTYIRIRPDRVDQWDPLGMLGIEMSFAAGPIFNIGLRIDYLLIYEKHIKGASRNGHILNTGITLFFNIGG